MKYAIVTFGCRVNQADSFTIEEELRRRGDVVAAPEHADLVVVNTCSVTASADQGARQTIRRIARTNPGVRVVVTGCYATRRPEEVSQLPNVVRVIANSRKDSLVKLLEAEGELTTAERFSGGDGPCGLALEPGVAGRTSLTLRVQTGCDQQCSYCIIPTTRGMGRSRPITAVLQEVSRAVEAGYREIAITGVHLGSYGRDIGDGTDLAGLVRVLGDWPDDIVFRVSSLEPMDCTPAIIDVAARSPRIAPHFHLPLQHGSDVVLRAMKRPYTSGDFQRVVERVHARLPSAAIGTDVIVGFPGETTEQFAGTASLLESLPLAYAHVFPYSDRPGTAATALESKVDGNVIRDRARVLRDVGAAKSRQFRRDQVGSVMRALTVDDGASVVTGNYLKVRISNPQPRNTWVRLRIANADPLEGFVTTETA
ncbi:MAG TPA: tRNA (N(6)-L-threonylcarbamoyladenosine(37)-C(2))-methylthiotransferase MtaB [Vicinamibacterales bacterium]|nr:tRNA (N(6)-L-threonylcarbamoyladenosine(37)-C(2))-methylthiotransferase MtaB [Vicinamibacterales bacterium]